MSSLIRSRKTRVSAVLATVAVSMGIVAGPAAAQGPQDGLVNLQINNNDVAVTVPVQVAANVCDVDVAILANLAEGGTTTCTATGRQITGVNQNDRPGNTNNGGNGPPA